MTNLVWAGFNLLPILPMDGGRVSRAVLGRIFGRSASPRVRLGVLVCAVVAYLLFRTGWGGPVTLVFLLLFAAQNFQGLMAAWRTEPDAPAPPQLVEAETLFRAGERPGPGRSPPPCSTASSRQPPARAPTTCSGGSP